MGLGVFLLSVLASIVAAILWAEFHGWAPKLARRILGIGIRRAPFMHRERLREEWASYLDDVPTPMSKLWSAVGFILAAERMRRMSWFQFAKAIRDYTFLRRLLWRHRMSAYTFGARSFSIKLIKRPCGNRHIVCGYRLPAALNELYKRYQKTVEDQMDQKVPAAQSYQARLGIVDLAEALKASARKGALSDEFPEADLHVVEAEWDTCLIVPPEKDSRSLRQLVNWLRRRRR